MPVNSLEHCLQCFVCLSGQVLKDTYYYTSFPVRLPGSKHSSTSHRFVINSKASLLRKKRVRKKQFYVSLLQTVLP